MTNHDIIIDKKYFEPIREGNITLLIFKTKIIENPEIGDYIISQYGPYDIKAQITDFYYKTFEEFTEKDSRKAGFISKDFLKDELMKKYELDSLNGFITSYSGEIFFCLEISVTKESSKIFLNDTGYDYEDILPDSIKNITFVSKDFNKEYYNPEYDEEIWRTSK